MSKVFAEFVKFTGKPVQYACFRTKVYYEDKTVQSRKIKGPAIIISNHTSVYDFPVMLYVFRRRYLRYLMAECLYEKKSLGRFLTAMGGLRVDRDTYDFSFVDKSLEVLDNGGVVGIFPESRLPTDGEERPLPFKPSTAYIALLAGVPVIPVYTNGSYFSKHRARVIIGKPIDVNDLATDISDDKVRLEKISEILRDKVIKLGNELARRTAKKQRRE